ncbi:MAG: 4-hydroxy-tetrahydrodipicolinate synthase [Deltaproteobacteria bacterium CG11_big_fil_rev_8_21_14_0_20_47_16]|nr:MAG: 4-hydroxy-tetrahydrodipicolinate synthase [Deltaproteobacteria bacterium CG11_big_fil_rev_8_21_14_0_20_47_16]
MRLSGAHVAIVTPFNHGKVDETALNRQIDFLIENGIDGIVACGTTGEASTLNDEEHIHAVELCVKHVAGRVPVTGGAGSNDTHHAIELSKKLETVGVDALLHVTPYYNKPTQQGLYLHFEAIAKATALPIILYNVPGRTGVDLLPETAARLAKISNIVAIKECMGVERCKTLCKMIPDLTVISGEDGLNYDMYQAGAKGCISVTGNVAPQMLSQVWDLFAEGKLQDAATVQEKLQPLNKILFIESNPIPVKTALAIMGRMREEFRLPLCEMQPANRAQLQQCLQQYKLC